ncbi:transcription factor VIP1-like [Neltuma alba]|uniref:transcription factor VIP1-like n=1 Tax=Neltuma alba TaxID=207710 RepID=UPI0010A4D161|nr:transcription factor VIP1-like [Prosopis alba]XP_028800189.1 transcription factor VIP1-like [Prosopis alba]
MSSITTAPVPPVKAGQRLETPPLGSHHFRPHSDSNSRITSYNKLAPFEPFDVDFIDDPLPPLPDLSIDPTTSVELPTTADFSPEELSYLHSRLNMPLGSLGDQIQSLSMDSPFMDYITGGGDFIGATENLAGNDAIPVNPVVNQAQVVYMDASTTVSTEVDVSIANEVKKAMPIDKITKVAMLDPKRAKRILANRESAARSKERRTRYAMDLEKKVQILQAQSTEISVKLAKTKTENSDLKAKKKGILREIEFMEETAKLREELNEALSYKLRQLKKEYAQKVAYKNHNFRGLLSKFSSQLAVYQVNFLRYSRLEQLGMPPSHSNQQA